MLGPWHQSVYKHGRYVSARTGLAYVRFRPIADLRPQLNSEQLRRSANTRNSTSFGLANHLAAIAVPGFSAFRRRASVCHASPSGSPKPTLHPDLISAVAMRAITDGSSSLAYAGPPNDPAVMFQRKTRSRSASQSKNLPHSCPSRSVSVIKGTSSLAGSSWLQIYPDVILPTSTGVIRTAGGVTVGFAALAPDCRVPVRNTG